MDAFTVSVRALIAVLIAALVALVVVDNRQWQRFKVEHKCKVVAYVNGSMFPTYGVSSNGTFVTGIGTIPDKTGWLCDDGVTYYR